MTPAGLGSEEVEVLADKREVNSLHSLFATDKRQL